MSRSPDCAICAERQSSDGSDYFNPRYMAAIVEDNNVERGEPGSPASGQWEVGTTHGSVGFIGTQEFRSVIAVHAARNAYDL